MHNNWKSVPINTHPNIQIKKPISFNKPPLPTTNYPTNYVQNKPPLPNEPIKPPLPDEKPPLPLGPPPSIAPPPMIAPPQNDSYSQKLKEDSLSWQQNKTKKLEEEWNKYHQQVEDYNKTSVSNPALDSINEEVRDFTKKYNEWLKEYETWKVDNKNHPDREMYNKYMSQWLEYKSQMESKKKDIQDRKSKIENSLTPQPSWTQNNQTPQPRYPSYPMQMQNNQQMPPMTNCPTQQQIYHQNNQQFIRANQPNQHNNEQQHSSNLGMNPPFQGQMKQYPVQGMDNQPFQGKVMGNQQFSDQRLPNQQMPIQNIYNQQFQGQPMNNQLVQGQPMNNQLVQGQPMNSQHVNNQQVQGQSINNQRVQGQPMNTQQVQGQPMNNQQVPGQPMNTQQVQGQPMNNQQIRGPNMNQQFKNQINPNPQYPSQGGNQPPSTPLNKDQNVANQQNPGQVMFNQPRMQNQQSGQRPNFSPQSMQNNEYSNKGMNNQQNVAQNMPHDQSINSKIEDSNVNDTKSSGNQDKQMSIDNSKKKTLIKRPPIFNSQVIENDEFRSEFENDVTEQNNDWNSNRGMNRGRGGNERGGRGGYGRGNMNNDSFRGRGGLNNQSGQCDMSGSYSGRGDQGRGRGDQGRGRGDQGRGRGDQGRGRGESMAGSFSSRGDQGRGRGDQGRGRGDQGMGRGDQGRGRGESMVGSFSSRGDQGRGRGDQGRGRGDQGRGSGDRGRGRGDQGMGRGDVMTSSFSSRGDQGRGRGDRGRGDPMTSSFSGRGQRGRGNTDNTISDSFSGRGRGDSFSSRGSYSRGGRGSDNEFSGRGRGFRGRGRGEMHVGRRGSLTRDEQDESFVIREEYDINDNDGCDERNQLQDGRGGKYSNVNNYQENNAMNICGNDEFIDKNRDKMLDEFNSDADSKNLDDNADVTLERDNNEDDNRDDMINRGIFVSDDFGVNQNKVNEFDDNLKNQFSSVVNSNSDVDDYDTNPECEERDNYSRFDNRFNRNSGQENMRGNRGRAISIRGQRGYSNRGNPHMDRGRGNARMNRGRGNDRMDSDRANTYMDRGRGNDRDHENERMDSGRENEWMDRGRGNIRMVRGRGNDWMDRGRGRNHERGGQIRPLLEGYSDGNYRKKRSYQDEDDEDNYVDLSNRGNSPQDADSRYQAYLLRKSQMASQDGQRSLLPSFPSIRSEEPMKMEEPSSLNIADSTSTPFTPYQLGLLSETVTALQTKKKPSDQIIKDALFNIDNNEIAKLLKTAQNNKPLEYNSESELPQQSMMENSNMDEMESNMTEDELLFMRLQKKQELVQTLQDYKLDDIYFREHRRKAAEQGEPKPEEDSVAPPSRYPSERRKTSHGTERYSSNEKRRSDISERYSSHEKRRSDSSERYSSQDKRRSDRKRSRYDREEREKERFRDQMYREQDFKKIERKKLQERDTIREAFDENKIIRAETQARLAALATDHSTTTCIDDLLLKPGRLTRPQLIVIILRGPPGSGKTHIAKLIKDSEVENGGVTPRMLCLDDYFMTDVEKPSIDENGKKCMKVVTEYQYDEKMASSYREAFFKLYRKQVDDCFFKFIVVDAIMSSAILVDQFVTYGASKGFKVFVAEVKEDIDTCVKRTTHHWSRDQITKISNDWQSTLPNYNLLDIKNIIVPPIQECEMEVISEDDLSLSPEQFDDDTVLEPSKWEIDASEQNKAKLDGGCIKHSDGNSLEEYMVIIKKKPIKPGQKTVRWADVEERKEQTKLRDIGFVIGQNNWSRMTDKNSAHNALNRTKYI